MAKPYEEELVATEAGWVCPGCPYTQDWAMWLSIPLHGWALYGLDKDVAFYRRHGSNLSDAKNFPAARADERRIPIPRRFVQRVRPRLAEKIERLAHACPVRRNGCGAGLLGELLAGRIDGRGHMQVARRR